MTDQPDPVTLKTPDEWCADLGVTVLDPDGWRTRVDEYPPRPWTDLISRAEFDARFSVSTVRLPAASKVVATFPASAEWLADQQPWADLEAEARDALRQMYDRLSTEEARP